MKSAESFFNWAFRTRANSVLKLYNGEMVSPEKMFLSFCSHDPAFVSNGPAGLNASIKGIGFLPKDEYLEETLAAYIEHIKTYDKDDKEYSKRGLALLVKYMYGEEAQKRVDFTKVGSLEMAISYELRGKMEIYDECESGKREIYQQFINAQHDVYHAPDMTRWLTRPAYIFRIEEVYDNCVTPEGFGNKMQYPY